MVAAQRRRNAARRRFRGAWAVVKVDTPALCDRSSPPGAAQSGTLVVVGGTATRIARARSELAGGRTLRSASARLATRTRTTHVKDLRPPRRGAARVSFTDTARCRPLHATSSGCRGDQNRFMKGSTEPGWLTSSASAISRERLWGTSAGAAVIVEAMFTGDADLSRSAERDHQQGLGLAERRRSHFLTRQRDNQLSRRARSPALVASARRVRRHRARLVVRVIGKSSSPRDRRGAAVASRPTRLGRGLAVAVLHAGQGFSLKCLLTVCSAPLQAVRHRVERARRKPSAPAGGVDRSAAAGGAALRRRFSDASNHFSSRRSESCRPADRRVAP